MTPSEISFYQWLKELSTPNPTTGEENMKLETKTETEQQQPVTKVPDWTEFYQIKFDEASKTDPTLVYNHVGYPTLSEWQKEHYALIQASKKAKQAHSKLVPTDDDIRAVFGCACPECRNKYLALKGAGQVKPSKPAKPELRTQKARGIQLLSRLGTIPFCIEPLTHKPLEEFRRYSYFPAFARPCPMRPRHGFVESRVVQNMAEVETVLVETLAADPEGELLFSSPIRATHNAVLTSNSLAIGTSNDGATAGKALTIPVAGKNYGRDSYSSFTDIAPDQDIYMELVHGDNSLGWQTNVTYAVQLREGPFVGRGILDYVPSPVTVTEVATVEETESTSNLDALLIWEKRIQDLSTRPGAVVYAPGRAITSHWGVHCVSNKVPFVTTKPPMIGDLLMPSSENAASLGQFDRKGFDTGFSIGWRMTDVSYPDAVHFLLGVLHNVPAMSASESKLVGAATAFALRLGASAVAGELRYALKRRGTRDKVYTRTWSKFPTRKLMNAPEVFRGPKKGALNDGSIGGIPWATAAEATIGLYRAVADRQAPLKSVVEHLNIVVNCAHNNGWWFNKFTSKMQFDWACQYPGLALASTCHVVHEVLKRQPDKIVRLRVPKAKPPKPVIVTAAQVNRRDNLLHVQYTVKGKSGYQTTNVSMPEHLAMFDKLMANGVETVPSLHGSERQYIQLVVNQETNQTYWDGSLLTPFIKLGLGGSDNG